MTTGGDDGLDGVRGWIRDARRVVVLTGAGISTESGIRDFRGPNGLWTKDPKAEMASQIRYYLADPEVRKAAWRGRVETFGRELEPNDGHRALVDLERSGRLHTLLTQNVDGLHHKAGSDPARIVEVHGTVREHVCLDCGRAARSARRSPACGQARRTRPAASVAGS